MDLGEVGWGDVDWIGLSQNRNKWRALVNSGSMKCWLTIECLASSGLSTSAQLHRVRYLTGKE
jgi:hypothetical protein